MRQVNPVKPVLLDSLAAELLDQLAHQPAARCIVLGGYFALKHYHDYRVSHDIDAWWDEAAGESERAQMRRILTQVLSWIAQSRSLDLRQRKFGDTESWELRQDQRAVFSFQISARTVRLEPYLASPWPPLQIESLADNVGSKMNALVQRGAPRDLLDLKEAVDAGLVSPRDCWLLWEQKNPGLDPQAAKLEVTRRLEELALRRPLHLIADTAERERAAAVRCWYRDVFLNV